MNKESVYEVAVWRAKEDPKHNKAVILNLTNQALEKFKGLKNRTVFQSVSDPHLMFDWVEWESEEQAMQAAQNMMQTPELNQFMNLIAKSELFEHYTIDDEHSVKNGNAEIVELVAYKLKPEADMTKFKTTYTKGIAEAEGYHNRYILKNAKGGNQWAEFVHWNSAEDAKKASAAMMQNPEIEKAFSMVDDIQMIHHYFRKFE